MPKRVGGGARHLMINLEEEEDTPVLKDKEKPKKGAREG